MLRPNRDPSPSPPSAEPPRIFLLAPDALQAQVALVEDALRARGFRVRVALGHRARRWVRNVPPGPPSLRVLCVAEIDPAQAEQLRKGRDDFHIVGLQTPLSVVHEIERITGRARVHRKPRPSRMYLAQPTLIEQQLQADRGWGWAVAAVILLTLGTGVGAIMAGTSRAASTPSEPAVTVRAPTKAVGTSTDSMAQRRDEPVLSAVAPLDPDALETRDDDERRADAPRR